MKIAIALLLVVCALSYHSVCAGKHSKCKLERMEIMKGINKLFEEGRAPQCAKDLEMERFKCTGGEDEDKDKEIRKEFRNWFKDQTDETKKECLKCFEDMAKTALEEAGDTLSDECKEKWEKIKGKMLGEKQD